MVEAVPLLCLTESYQNHYNCYLDTVYFQSIMYVSHQLILCEIKFQDISKHHRLSLMHSSQSACLQLHTFNFKLIGTIHLYAMFVYLITETLPQLKLSICVSC